MSNTATLTCKLFGVEPVFPYVVEDYLAKKPLANKRQIIGIINNNNLLTAGLSQLRFKGSFTVKMTLNHLPFAELPDKTPALRKKSVEADFEVNYTSLFKVAVQ